MEILENLRGTCSTGTTCEPAGPFRTDPGHTVMIYCSWGVQEWPHRGAEGGRWMLSLKEPVGRMKVLIVCL